MNFEYIEEDNTIDTIDTIHNNDMLNEYVKRENWAAELFRIKQMKRRDGVLY